VSLAIGTLPVARQGCSAVWKNVLAQGGWQPLNGGCETHICRKPWKCRDCSVPLQAQHPDSFVRTGDDAAESKMLVAQVVSRTL
jgi:hypothetical protein